MAKIINLVAILSIVLSVRALASDTGVSREFEDADVLNNRGKLQWEPPEEDLFGDPTAPVDATRYCGTFWYPRSCYKYCDNRSNWCWVDTSKTCYQNSDCDQTAECAGPCGY